MAYVVFVGVGASMGGLLGAWWCWCLTALPLDSGRQEGDGQLRAADSTDTINVNVPALRNLIDTVTAGPLAALHVQPHSPQTFTESNSYHISVGTNSTTLTRGISVNVLGGEPSLFSVGRTNGPLVEAVLESQVLVTARLRSAGAQPVIVTKNEVELINSSWDWNVNAHALEVVNENLEPMLQVVYTTPHNVSVYGRFVTLDGKLLVSPTGIFGGDDEGNKLKRIFRYPSRKYRGQEIADTGG